MTTRRGPTQRVKIRKNILAKVKKALDPVVDAFSDGMIDSPTHPVITGITRGNWMPSSSKKLRIEQLYGYTWNDIYDAMQLNQILVGGGQAQENSRNQDWKLGNKLFWTNSLPHIKDLEFRHKFIDAMALSGTLRAREAARK